MQADPLGMECRAPSTPSRLDFQTVAARYGDHRRFSISSGLHLTTPMDMRSPLEQLYVSVVRVRLTSFRHAGDAHAQSGWGFADMAQEASIGTLWGFSSPLPPRHS